MKDEECVGEGNRIVSLSALAGLADVLKCPKCSSRLICNEGVGNRRGLVTKISFDCEGECGWQHLLTNPYTKESKGLNTKSVFGSRMMGKGRTGIEAIACCLDLPPPVVGSAYSEHNKFLAEALRGPVHEYQLAAVQRVREAYGVDNDRAVC